MIERFAQMPSALQANARWERLVQAEPSDGPLSEKPHNPTKIPVLLVHPDWSRATPVPLVIWLHGRTASKEVDPGRYLRWMRAGIATCAVDLPGHGERSDPTLQTQDRAWDVLVQMVNEIDQIVIELGTIGVFDMTRMGVGGMSLGGMAALGRLTRPHSFRCASVEATIGDWSKGTNRSEFERRVPQRALALEPITHLDAWREIPLQAIHAKQDAWVPFESQALFIAALRRNYRDSALIDFVQYDRTGAPHEHIGFGRMAANAKDRQRDFFARWLSF
jgi:dipeptidyl aminopeptidase/acylaminoacyl peptidase